MNRGCLWFLAGNKNAGFGREKKRRNSQNLSAKMPEKNFALFALFCAYREHWCLVHRPGFRHQIAAAPAANQIVPFSLIRFKYSTLPHQLPSPDGVVVRASGYNAEGRGIESRWNAHLE